jgi:hypothetical protein
VAVGEEELQGWYCGGLHAFVCCLPCCLALRGPAQPGEGHASWCRVSRSTHGIILSEWLACRLSDSQSGWQLQSLVLDDAGISQAAMPDWIPSIMANNSVISIRRNDIEGAL